MSQRPNDDEIDVLCSEDVVATALEDEIDDDGGHNTDTVPMRKASAVRAEEGTAVSPPNEFDPGIADATARPHSSASHRSRSSSWSSGKHRRAPPPPPPPPPRPPSSSHGQPGPSSRRSSRASSCVSSLHSSSFRKRRPGLPERLREAWSEPRKRRQMNMWIGFMVVVLATVVLAAVVFSRFASGFGGGDADGDGERGGGQHREVEDVDIAKERFKAAVWQTRDLSGEDSLVLIGGRDEERGDSVEILGRDGACNLVQGFPAPLPAGRTGHMTAAVGSSSLLACGGVDSETKRLSRKCWSYNKGTNKWTQVPGLREATRYGACAAVGKAVYVFGGTDGNGKKSAEVQVFDTGSFTWSRGPEQPQPLWGHCAASLEVQGKIVVTGGWAERGVRSSLKDAYRFHPKPGDWESLPEMHQGRATHGCARTTYPKTGEEVIVVAGGMDENHDPVRSVEVLFLSGPERTGWVRLGGEMEAGRAWYPAVGILRDRLVVAGGRDDEGFDLDSAEVFSPSEKRFAVSQSLRLQWKRSDGRAELVPAVWFPSCMAGEQ